MTTRNASNDLNVGAMLKDHMRDCRLGHCRHSACHRKAERRFASAGGTETVETEADFDPGFDVGATLKDYQRDCRLGICHHEQCQEQVRRRVRRAKAKPAGSDRPFAYVLTDDNRIDKRATREARLFGSGSAAY